jgi:hypothetical protein
MANSLGLLAIGSIFLAGAWWLFTHDHPLTRYERLRLETEPGFWRAAYYRLLRVVFRGLAPTMALLAGIAVVIVAVVALLKVLPPLR